SRRQRQAGRKPQRKHATFSSSLLRRYKRKTRGEKNLLRPLLPTSSNCQAKAVNAENKTTARMKCRRANREVIARRRRALRPPHRFRRYGLPKKAPEAGNSSSDLGHRVASASCPLWVMCGRRPGKNFLTLLQH